ncbi:MAG: hypothetical protein IPK70_12050 [Flavobacteriales bacterium]|jgi:hypothetical protein|nr:hypothetical protein [Flavobacteriales bacterium]
MRALGLVLFVLLLAMAEGARAQQPAPAKTKAAFRVTFNFDYRNTNVNAEQVRFYGLRIGAQRGKDLLGIGFYGLGDDYVQSAVPIEGVGVREHHTDFDFVALSYERLLVDSRRWQVGVPVSVGLGNYRRSYLGTDNRLVPYAVNELVPIEATLHADYSILRWLFIGAGAGYRHVLAADRSATVMLSDWTWYGKVGLRLGVLVKGIFKRKEKGNGPE